MKPWIMLSNQAAQNSESVTPATAQSGANSGLDILDLVIVGTCAYLTFCGIAGKGSIFKDDQIQPSRKADYRKLMRTFALVAGPLGMLSIVFERFVNRTLGIVTTAIFLLLIVAVCILIRPMNVNYVKKKKRGKTPRKDEHSK